MILAIIINLSLGGDVGKFGNRIEAGEVAAIKGVCASACTMYLKTGCVYPDATLGFHSSSVTSGKEEDRLKWNNIIASFYPKNLSEWYLAGPANSKRVVWISGKQAIALGAKQCE